ncbi:traB domain-containing protein [Prunus yedoensis var. nudiflora]|uniref:TraB domain-containing protein n=1 Tax=Prunus yedoensis var. nudiflora TaxID=2094558 RepID=A0A314UDE2_PRUYE|nr:traB domain-containing protein [Prunus yedoensis var. nudiflora]
MNRSTRLVTRLYSPESPRVFLSLRRKPDLPLTPPTVRVSPTQTARYGPAIPRARPPAAENFVHVENPTIEDLSDSIVGVDVPRDEYDDDVVSTSAAAESSDQRKVLPEELSRSVVVLTCESTAEGGVCDVHLVGTAHVSVESCREVEAVISYLKPEVVFLELCSSRVAALTPQNLKVPTMGEMIEMWKKKHNAFGIVYSWFLAKVSSKLEVFPGAEFRVAYEEAMKYGGRVILGDRPVQITLRRTWAKMPLWHKIKLLYSFLFQAVFLPSPDDLNKMLKEMDDVDMLTLVIQEMSKEYPTLMETLVHERDQYMSSTLLRIASEHSSVVAVVGKGHLQGIKKHWKQPVVVKDLMEIPSQQSAFSTAKVLKSFGCSGCRGGHNIRHLSCIQEVKLRNE